MMRLSDERYEQIKEKVVEMFETYGIKSVPISGFEITTKMGITVVPYSAYKPEVQKLMLLESEDGFLPKSLMEVCLFIITMKKTMAE